MIKLNWQTKSLHQQITVVIVSAVVVLALCFTLIALWSTQRYHNEVTQKLYASLAQYIVDHQAKPLINDRGSANQQALKQLAQHVMMINPLVEVYLLSPTGKVLGHALPEVEVQATQVDVVPIQQRLKAGPQTLVKGQNPRQPDQKTLFSAAELSGDGQLRGYLYVVLHSQLASSISDRLQGSHITQMVIVAVVSLMVLSLFVLTWIFRRLTQPLRQLTEGIRQFQQSDWMGKQGQEHCDGQEMRQLETSFQAMKQRIVSQFQHLQENDRLRRELVTNVSHDLRTPLASLQGYIESLMLKRQHLNESEVSDYLSIAHRSSVRLTHLVTELFELSRLDAGHVQPELESFSLLELAYDVLQDYQLAAESKNVQLEVINHCQPPCQVVADLRLMERVIQNLLDNAIRYTPAEGVIAIELKPDDADGIQVAVSDTGKGIEAKDLPHIFESRYCADYNRAEPESGVSGMVLHKTGGTGLGLSIVKRILELHHSSIQVVSEKGKGTRFEFALCHPQTT